MNAREARRFRIPSSTDCTIPNAAAAYSVTLTAVPPQPLAFMTLWPAGGSQPNISSINSFSGRVLANNVIVPASADGSIDVYAYDRTDFLVDINGYFAPDNGAGLYYFPVKQCRVSDSSVSGSVYADDTARTISVPATGNCAGIPITAKGYSVNVTAVPNGGSVPFITAYPTGQARPNASILNAFEGQIVANSAIVPAGANGAIDVYAFRRTNVTVDLSGYFSGISAINESAVFGTDGGTTTYHPSEEISQGTTVSIPAGALLQSASISVSFATGTLPPGIAPAAPILDFQPTGLTFVKPINVTLCYSDVDTDGYIDGTSVPETELRAITSSDGSNWTPLSIVRRDTARNCLVVETNHFSLMALGISTSTSFDASLPTKTNANGWEEDSIYNPAASPVCPVGLSSVCSSRQIQLSYPFASAAGGTATQLRVRANSQDRIKMRKRVPSGNGSFRWHVFVPAFKPGDGVGVAAFLYADDHHELDFEIGYGSTAIRKDLRNTSPNQGVIFLTSQDNNAISCAPQEKKQGCRATTSLPITLGAWHTFQLNVQEAGPGRSVATWFVDDVQKFSSVLKYWVSEFSWYIQCSLEVLTDYGDHIPFNETVAYFDSVSVSTATPSNSSSLSAPKLLSPANGSVFSLYPRTTVLRWEPVAGAAQYALEIDYGWDSPGYCQSLGAATIPCYCQQIGSCAGAGAPPRVVTAPPYTFDFVGAQPGRWRVWALDSQGRAGEKSEWWTFRYTI
ncbi:MAG: hypothetical protein HY820_26510 [Acidobacteria bacterium]|nr:hypothetical protein [Acidobacteriota bacterium]